MPRAQLAHGSFGKVRRFYQPDVNPSWLKLAGVTKDSTGAPLASCLVELYDADTDVVVNAMTSDASGNYSFDVVPGRLFYLRAYKAGAPDVVGSTRNDVIGA